MSFNGYLIKVGSYGDFFNKYIESESYKIAKKVIDVDSYRDANGILHRNALSHVSYTISFDIRPVTNDEMEEFLSAIRSNFSSSLERKLSLTFYVPEDNNYVTADVYLPDIEFNINHIENYVIIYEKTTIKFIGY